MKSTKLLIDGNILLDVMQRRGLFYRDSSLVWKLCETGRCKGYISALTIADLVYIMRKELNSDDIKSVLAKLSLIFEVEDLLTEDLLNAADMGWRDFEDAAQSATAKRIKADYIVTRNLKDFEKSSVPAASPGDLLAMISI